MSKKASPAEKMTAAALFEQEYAKLNEQQKQAVDTIEGPVMVVAGPGSGKTQVVALRVANILRKTQMRPSNILCLTFSVSGASAMRDRLRWLIGPDAYRVRIETIHGFCNDVIRTHPQVFEEFSALEQVTDVQRYHLMNGIIDALPPGCPLINPKDRYGRTKDILSRISEIKREDVPMSRLEQAVDVHRAAMRDKSKPGTKAHERNLRDAEKFAAFVDLYKQYQQVLREEGMYDYEDMIHFVLAALRQEDWLLASLQERYQYVLVDEYQDTNGSQSAVIETLTTYVDKQEPNVFVVGDDDQAIYRFQGANVRNMLAFRERFPGCPVITLNVSYRSTQPVLDVAMRLIAHNEDRLVNKLDDIDKTLVSGRKEKDGPAPAIVRPVSDAVECFAIAELVEDAVKDGIPLTEIAVFTRNNDELFPIHEALISRGIPAQVTGKLDLLRHPKVRECITLLQAVTDVQSDSALSAGLACPCFGCHPADLGALWTYQREQNRDGEKKTTRVKLFDALTAVESTPDVLDHLRKPKELLAARDLLLRIALQLPTFTLPDAMEALLRESGLLPKTEEETVPLDVVALSEFFEHVKERCREHPQFNARQLLKDLDDRQEYGIPLRYAIPHIVDDGVQLLTAHGSKGLEFECVIIANFREKHWDNKRAPAKLAMPEDLVFSSTDEDGMALQDERRLAYVAFTRAKKTLIISCPMRMTRGEKEQDIALSAFAAEAGPLEETEYDLRSPEKASLLLIKKQEVDEGLAAFLRHRLETFELSVTALNRYLENPQQFLWEDLLALPKAKKPELAYGTAVHAALQEWAIHVGRGEDFGLDALIEAFEKDLNEREILTEQWKKELAHLGRQSLKRYYESRLFNLQPIVHGVEQRLSGRFGDIPLKGMVDRIDLEQRNGSRVHITDYKTGRPKTEKQAREEHNGGLYRQLTFYKLLSEVSPTMAGYEPVSFTLDFIGERDEEPRVLRFEIPDSDVADLRKLVTEVWGRILALDFTPMEKKASDTAD